MSKEFFYIAVKKGEGTSYGMTLLGSGPCIVSDTTADGPAARSGVKPGYVLLEINGKNVINKGHKEVREFIRSTEAHGWINFKFSTLDSACDFFGEDLRNVYENALRRKSNNCRRKSSPKPSQKSESASKSAGNKMELLKPTNEVEENNDLFQSVGVQVNNIGRAGDSPNNSRRTAPSPRNMRPTQPRTGSEIIRRSNVQKSKDLARWMRSTDAANITQVSPAHSPSASSHFTEIICLYYLNLVDLLGPLEEPVFKKNVESLKIYSTSPQFWARLVVSDKRLTIYRPEGKYVSYSQKNIRDVFVHDDGNFFGFSAIRMSKVQAGSPSLTSEMAQTMDVFSCHILCVSPEAKLSLPKQRSILTQLWGKERLLPKTANTNSYFPQNAAEVSAVLRNLVATKGSPAVVAGKAASLTKAAAKLSEDPVDLLSNTKDTMNLQEKGEDFNRTEDATAYLNSASELRSSMRKYAPFLGMNRSSLSSESVDKLPKIRAVPNQSRYNSVHPISGTSLPTVILDNDAYLSSQSDGSLSSFEGEMERHLKRGTISSSNLPAKRNSVDFITPKKCSIPEIRKIDMLEVLDDARSINLFQEFLRQEHSEENITFWLACRDYRAIKKPREMQAAANRIFQRFLAIHAPEPVNVDGAVRKAIEKTLKNATTEIFDAAAKQVFDLMNMDPYRRFLASAYYLQLCQILDPNWSSLNKSMPCLNRTGSSGASRRSHVLSWLGKKKSDLDEMDVCRQSLPALDSTGSRGESLTKNPLQKLIEKGRKSFSARVKFSQRESLMEFVSDNRRNDESSRRTISPIPFEFRKPRTPPPKLDGVVRRPPKASSAGKEKRLSLQSFQRTKAKGVTEPTEWTFSRNSMDELDNSSPENRPTMIGSESFG